MVLRIHSLSFDSADLPGAMIAPLSATQKLAQVQPAKFSVNVIPKGLQGSYQGHLAGPPMPAATWCSTRPLRSIARMRPLSRS